MKWSQKIVLFTVVPSSFAMMFLPEAVVPYVACYILAACGVATQMKKHNL